MLDLFNFNSLKIGKKIQRHMYQNGSKSVMIEDGIRELDRYVATRREIDTDWTVNETNIVWRIFDRQELTDLCGRFGMVMIGDYAGFDSKTKANWEPNINEQRILTVFKKI